MPMLDIFNQNAFNVLNLSLALNKMPYKPGRLGQLGIFEKSGISTLSAVIEERQGKLSLIPTAARGTSPNVLGGVQRKIRAFPLVHLPLAAAVEADDVQGIRAFGSETELDTVGGLVNDKLAQMRADFETTHEFYRVGAIQGVMLDSDGSTTLYNWFTEFGISETVVDFAWGAANSIKSGVGTVRRAIEDALGMDTYTGIRAICGKTAYASLIIKDEVKAAYNTYTNGMSDFLRNDQTRGQFSLYGVDWEEYRGTVGGTPFVADSTIRFFPTGVPRLFQEVYGPANFIETVNTKGLPVYVKQKVRDFETGVDLFGQSNPLVLCTRPSVLIKGTTSGTAPT